ncbi:MAG: hypothetical protein WEB29_06500 [Chloroflexota bacterium]
MTMQNTPHPDDERLAAFAGGDSDALADSSLVAHLTACDRCRPLVDELSLLRGALAELPDLAPSRPLRLIPPVPSPAPAGGRRSWLRRLTAPAMAAGVGLVLVGAVGFGASGAVGDLFGRAASAPGAQEASASDRQFGAFPSAAPSLAPGDTTGNAGSESSPRSMRSGEPASPTSASPAPASPPPSVDEAAPTEQVTGNSSPEQPWLTLLIAGVGLFGISTALRFSLSPRAG